MQNPATDIPFAEKIAKELKTHGHTRNDEYYWLNQRENPQVLEYLKAENHFLKQGLKHTEDLQERLFEEITGRIKQDDSSVPYKKNGYWYYVRYYEGMEHPVYCRKKESLQAAEEIMLDVNKLAEKHEYYKVGSLSVSPDNEWLAYGEDTLSRRIYNVRFKNLKTGQTLDHCLEYTTGSVAWAEDNRTVFYTVKDSSLRAHKVYKHYLHTDTREDIEVYHETDPTFTCAAYKTKSERFLMIASFSTVSNEFRYLQADNPDGDFQVLQQRERLLEYSVAHFGDYWYIRTNKDEATNFKLVKTPLNQTEKEHWREVVPHREDVYLEGLEIFSEFLVLEERREGLTQIRISRWDGRDDYYLSFPEETYTAGIGNNPDFESNTLRYGYSSLTTPTSIFDFDMTSREQVLMKQQEVVGGHDPALYQSERVWADAPDGKKVPISLVYRKDLKNSNGNPLLLYGYGAYGLTVDPGFSSTRLSLLDRGFVFAIAHIRGGQYLGRNWYDDGKLFNKKNTFSDFIACAEKLIQTGYTNTEKMYAMGGSAGGLLMGAVINERPELFNGVIAAVPFVDVVTTMLDETIPLTTGEYDEWGNPNDEKYYHYILSYSPYDNVRNQDYPALLITTGLHDSQVQYWEPAKWMARLRAKKTNHRPLYLYTNMDTGHGGAAGRFEAYRETALEYAFLMDLAGIKD